ncbi:hypothetical protein [Streptomyces sp. enrichment culture]|uniref:hypothetical protein n=1 Tax=Streptomyces sp. enrichment culture TaxID=1795815 RepID=UPI003F54A77F
MEGVHNRLREWADAPPAEKDSTALFTEAEGDLDWAAAVDSTIASTRPGPVTRGPGR